MNTAMDQQILCKLLLLKEAAPIKLFVQCEQDLSLIIITSNNIKGLQMNLCPKCGTNMGKGSTACYKCGEIIFHPNFTPYKVRSCEHKYTGKVYQQINRGKRGTCENCERPNMWRTIGLCGACLSQIRINRYGKFYNFDKNSKEGQKRLHDYREKRWPERFKAVA